MSSHLALDPQQLEQLEHRRLVEVVDALEAYQALVKRFPLYGAEAWRPVCRSCQAPLHHLGQAHSCPRGCQAPEARTSQRLAAQMLNGEVPRYFALFGGNRSGKTLLGAMLTACAAHGRDHPAVLDWCQRNGVSPLAFPEAPAAIACSALDSGDSIEVQRPMLEQYLPEGTRWRNRFGGGECRATLPNGSTVLFKTDAMGREGFQGSSWDWLWLDEEHRRQVWDEARMRLLDRRGRAVFTMTPLKGLTWVYDRFVGEPDELHRSAWLSIFDNPYLPQGEAADVLRGFGEHELAARAHGQFATLEGRVWPTFMRATHVVEPFQPPPAWPVYRTIDFGVRNPFACLWVAHDPKDDVLHVFREYYQRERTIAQHAQVLNGHPEQVALTVCDPEDASARLTLAREHGIHSVAGLKAVRPGINAVAERLRLDVEGRPHLLVHSSCQQLIRELEGYIWRTSGGKADAPDAPLKRDDHGCDALRYLVLSLGRRPGVS